MAGYVIRGGEVGKARLHVIGAALERSTNAWLAEAGVGPGWRCLDLGCGGGDVTLAMARQVGPSGWVLGIDMDPVKVELARRDAVDGGLVAVEFQVGDATALDVDGEFDLVYARFLLTHLSDPTAVLQRMVRAVKPGAVIVVEDLDHSAVFAYPPCAALEDYLRIYAAVSRRRGGDPEIGPKLPGMLRRLGVVDVHLNVVQPAFMGGDAKRIHQITLENINEAVLAGDLATEEQLRSLNTRLAIAADDPNTIIAFPRIFQVSGRRPAADVG